MTRLFELFKYAVWILAAVYATWGKSVEWGLVALIGICVLLDITQSLRAIAETD